MLWCCRLHNEVNEKLGKPPVPCDVKALDLRWRKGPGSCYGGSEEEGEGEGH